MTTMNATDGRDLYYDRWWAARLRGIVLRPWEALPATIRHVWDERAQRPVTGGMET